MALVTSTEYQREGTAINADISMLSQQIAAVQALQRADPAGYPFPGGTWWQEVTGWAAGWSQFYSEQVQPTPVMPVHDDSDLQAYRATLEGYKTAFVQGQKVNKTQLSAGSATQPPPGAGGLTTALWLVFGIAALGSVGYVLTGVARIEGR